MKFINDVLLIPNLQQNLLSVNQMIQKGYSLFFKENSCTIYNKYNSKKIIATLRNGVQ